ncbi:MAG: segregation/condensation protein A, partial [Phycisphaeraceae bacterium]|nr:segregation/condensation protein A [Phycisphaeraceae bacterium]
YLIKRDEIDIHDIPISHITHQYLEHVRKLRDLDINLAGEFLVMAATLMEIKSALMSMRDPSEAEGEEAETVTDPEDPRFELVQQLLAYKRFKDAAHELDHRREDFAARFPLRPAPFEADKPDPQSMQPLEMDDVSVWDLMEAFTGLMEQINVSQRTHEVIDDDTPIELHAEDIMDRLGRDGSMTLQAMFAGRGSVSEMIGLFLATLELIRQRKVKATQPEAGGPICLERLDESQWMDPTQEEAETEPISADPARPEDFDWPDEKTRRRYERRQGRRARGEVIVEDQEFEEDVAALEADEQEPVAAPGSEQSGPPAAPKEAAEPNLEAETAMEDKAEAEPESESEFKTPDPS